MWMSHRWRRNGWSTRRLSITLAALIGAALATGAGWHGIAARALAQEEAGYILLVPLVIAWLIFVRRSRLAMATPRWSAGGLAVLIAAAGVYLGLGVGLDKPVGRHAGAVLVAVGVLATCLGPRLLSRFAAPLCAAVFLVPPSAIAMKLIGEPLRWAAVRAASGIYGVFGGEAFIRGDHFVWFSGTRWHHVPLEATCDVLATITALWVVAYAFVFGTPLRGAVRALALALTPIIGMGCCIAAVSLTLLLAADAREAVFGTWLVWGAWLTLVAAFFGLLGLLRLLVWAEVPVRRYQLADGR